MRPFAIFGMLALTACGSDPVTVATDPPGTSHSTFEQCLQANQFLSSEQKLSAPQVARNFAHGFTTTQDERPNDLPSLDVARPIHLFQGLLIAMNVGWYGAAFLRDAQLTLAQQHPWTHRPRDLKAGWKAWDVRLKAACDDLQSLAKTSGDGCMPSVDAMLKYLAVEYGADHPAIAPLKRARVDAAVEAAKKG